ncbi:hypothetical protein GCM10027059_39310 [Myceligenerans halotolerans]
MAQLGLQFEDAADAVERLGPVRDHDHDASLTTTFPEVTAVKEDRLVAVPSSGLFPGSVGNVSAVEKVAQALYPEAF